MSDSKKGVSFKADLENYRTYQNNRPEFLYRVNRYI